MILNERVCLLFLVTVVITLNSVKCDNNSTKVVIIGGGITGITAASQLFKQGYTNVTILEAESRIGGRIKTQKVDDKYLELGIDMDTYSVVGDSDVLLNIIGVNHASEFVIKLNFNESISVRIPQAAEVTRYDLQENSNEKVKFGYSLNNTGIDIILDILLKKYPNTSNELDVDIQLNTKVTKINWNEYPLRIDTENGRIFYADKIILAIPLAVLRQNYSTLFNPRLSSSKIDAIEKLRVDVINKVFLKYETPWWNNNLYSYFFHKWEIDHNAWPSKIIMITKAQNHLNYLIVYIVGEEFKNVSDAEVNTVLTNLLKMIAKQVNNVEHIADPVSMIRTKWDTDENFKGSMTYLFGDDAMDLAKPLTNDNGTEVVYFAGESIRTTSFKYQPINEAINSGTLAANTLCRFNMDCLYYN